jgi:TatA/E family protein of Tat protein translocase
MGPFGVQEMMLIVVLALLLFGPKKLPELARLLGKGMTEFRRAKNELKSTFDTHMRELEREAQMEDLKKNPPASPAPVYNPYKYMADESGNVSTDYGYNGLSEPPVETHVPETPSLPPAPPVQGTIPRSIPETASTNGNVHEEHHV